MITSYVKFPISYDNFIFITFVLMPSLCISSYTFIIYSKKFSLTSKKDHSVLCSEVEKMAEI